MKFLVMFLLPLFFGTAVAGGPTLTEDRERLLTEVYINYLIAEIKSNPTSKELAAYLTKGLKPQDRRFFHRLLSTPTAPDFRRSGRTLIVSKQGDEVRLEFVSLVKHQFRVNGTLYTVDPRRSALRQFEKFTGGNSRRATSLWQVFLLEEAQANASAAVQTVSWGAKAAKAGKNILQWTVAFGIAQSITNASYCGLVVDKLGFKPSSWGCEPYTQQKIAGEIRANAPNMNALKDLQKEDKSVVDSYEVQRELKCPHQLDGSGGNYEAILRKVDSGAKNSSMDWFRVDLAYKSDASPDKAEVTKSDDPGIVLRKFRWTGDDFCVQVKAGDMSLASGAAAPEWVDLCSSNTTMTPTEKAYYTAAKDLMTFVNARVAKCNVEKAEASNTKPSAGSKKGRT